MRDKVATEWWSQALYRYHDLHRTAVAEGVAVCDLPAVNEEHVELFEAALRQQLRRGLRQANRQKVKSSGNRQHTDGCDVVLFADNSGVCEELAQAAQAARIERVQQVLPEHTVMMIYADQVLVGSNSAHDHALRVLWSTHDETALHNSLQAVSRYLGIAEKKLRPIIDAEQLRIQQRGGHLHFTCNGITAVVEEKRECNTAHCCATQSYAAP